jgi:hypothetical protein
MTNEKAIDLWPNESFCSDGITEIATRDVLFPSGRQAVLHAVEKLGGRREQKIALPEYSSHCLISTVAKKITPLPISAVLAQPSAIDIILLYSQWGWERPLKQLDAVKQVFTKASIILDRVDSLSSSLVALPGYYVDQEVLQVFSLNKLLGVGGGGLVASAGNWLRAERGSCGEGRLCRELSDLKNSLGLESVGDMIRGWQMSDLQMLTPELIDWLDGNSLTQSIHSAAIARRERLDVVAEFSDDLEWPAWMLCALGEGAQVFPGIAPLFVRNSEVARELADVIFTRTNVRVAVYHFDKSPSHISPQWSPCIAVPLHWKIAVDTLRWIIDFWLSEAKGDD